MAIHQLNNVPLQRGCASIMSPLRYPGAKRRLASYLGQTLVLNDLQPGLFVEPFAGGASVSIQLLNDGLVGSIGLADRDPLVASFWRTVFFDTEWLIEQVMTIPVTLSKWQEFKCQKPRTVRQQALACLFLNRTSFSGILAPGAGPIGGTSQTSPYNIECRFPRDTLAKRISQAGRLKDRVAFVWNTSWRQTMAMAAKMLREGRLPSNPFVYMDPPFFAKADRLYTYYFNHTDHIRLRDFLVNYRIPWVLSYDSAPMVYELYASELDTRHVEVLYSSSKEPGSSKAQEVIVSNLRVLPMESRLWRESLEWKRGTGAKE